jgi:hypothetical protein
LVVAPTFKSGTGWNVGQVTYRDEGVKGDGTVRYTPGSVKLMEEKTSRVMQQCLSANVIEGFWFLECAPSNKISSHLSLSPLQRFNACYWRQTKLF